MHIFSLSKHSTNLTKIPLEVAYNSNLSNVIFLKSGHGVPNTNLVKSASLNCLNLGKRMHFIDTTLQT